MNNNWNYNNDNRRNMRGRNRGGRGYGNRGNRGFWSRQGGGTRGFDDSFDRPNYGRRDFNQHWKSQPNRNVPSKRLSEANIFVTEYINKHEGFNGIIKSRFSDFQVSEINEKGEIAKLTDLSPPELAKENEVVDDEYLLLNKYNTEILSMETWDKINKIAVSTDHDVEKVEIDVTGMTKEQRTKIHDAVKKAFGDSVIGSTVAVQDKKFVTFDKYRKGVRIDKRVKWVWPGEYVHFVVYKENCDTMEAASRIAERLRMQVKPALLGYAGTKDRRAKTSQWFSLRKFDPRKIASACSDLRDIQVGNYSFSPDNLKLGMLKGNQFRICLRNVTASEQCVAEACALLQQQGFVNYYGLQRFGTRIETPTYEIGKRLLQGNFREAIRCILSERPGPMWAALNAYHTGSAYAALRLLPREASNTEARLLRALAQNENDLVGALDKVTRNARLLYIHSYQSLIWNRVVSKRLRDFSHNPVPGDLVPLADVRDDEMEDDSDGEDNQNEESDQNGAENNKTADNKPNKNVTEKKEAKTTDKENKGKTMIPVKVLTQEDCDSGRYSILDVVMPLPGSSVEYPPNMKDFYRDLLTKDELRLDMKHKYKGYAMCGGYRHVVVRPAAFSWRCERYADPFADLQLSDVDMLLGETNTGAVADGKYKAVLITMTLPSSCYATMALRELLKVDTSGDNQALQNNYHKSGNKGKMDTDNGDEAADVATDKGDEEKTGTQCSKAEELKENVEGTSDENTVQKRKLHDDLVEVDVKKTKQSDDLE